MYELRSAKPQLQTQLPPQRFNNAGISPDFLRSQISALEDHLTAQETQISELVTRLAEFDSLPSIPHSISNTAATAISDIKDDDYLAKSTKRLYSLIRNFVHEFLRERVDMFPSRFPPRIREFLDQQDPTWKQYSNGGKNKRLHRAVAQKYISFFLIGKLLIPALPFANPTLSDTFETLLNTFKHDEKIQARWRSTTLQCLLSASANAPSSNPLQKSRIVTKICTELWKDTRKLWIPDDSKIEAQQERLKIIVEQAFQLAVEFKKLPHGVKCVVKFWDYDKVSKCIDGEVLNGDYSTFSHESELSGAVVFPGIYRSVSLAGSRTNSDEIAAEYIPVQFMTY
ncbi:hypothetical protein ABW19_dt0207318 [Dactylella cylindrospora]|nr:hypothetical protein ABW19_dt0207318 [Dactylella cylindrospora]